uniref:Pre-mRNA-splicing regulator WTAP n=1 Tax=Anopheles dirus TaxID=7168 RepID=A0A182MYR9_9DIPT
MSAPEDTTATAQPAPDHLLHQQNVVPASATLSSANSSATAITPAAAGTVAPAHSAAATSNAGSATVTTLSAAPAVATDSATGASPSLPANNGSNSSHSTTSSSDSHTNKEVVGAGGIGIVPEGKTSNDGSAPVDATDATSSSGQDKPDATTSNTPKDTSNTVGSAAATGTATAADSNTTIEYGDSSGGSSTPTAAESPVSAAGDAASTKLLGVSVGAATTSSAAVTNGGGGSNNPSVSVLPGTSSAPRGRELADTRSLEYQCRMLEEELQSVKESEARIKQQYSESQRRERILARRVLVQEQEVRDYSKQISELKYAQAPGPAALRSALLDPAVNILFQKLKAELQATKAKLEETQNELSAWKFTPDSNTGKRLMAKCRLLYQENEELGKMTSNGRLAKLESELALQKSYNEEVKKSQLELDDFLQELDEDVEGMQGTIVFLQQELKQTKDARDEMEKEVMQLRAYITANLGPFSGSANNPTSGSTPTDERSSSLMLMMDTQDSNSNSNNSHGHGVYHNPDGGGPESIGGSGGGGGGSGGSSVGGAVVGDIGGGITPIYLVNGGGSSGGNADVGCRLVNKSSSSSDQDMLVYSNRTHCGGVVTNSNELRTTPSTDSSGPASTSAALSGSTVTDSNSSGSTGSVATSSNNISIAAVNGTSLTVGGAVLVSSGETLVNELKDPVLPSDVDNGSGSNLCGRTTNSNAGSISGGVGGVADGAHSVNSTSSSNSAASKQHQLQPPLQQQQQRTSNNVGRNGGRTTVAARKRNYNETELDSVDPLLPTDTGSGGIVVSDAHGSESVQVMDVDAECSASATSGGVANGKLSQDTEQQQQQQQQDVEPNSNKRMTRSGKGKTAAATASSTAAASLSSSSASSASVTASNVLMTSATKKLRRGSIAPEDEVDPLGDAQPPQQSQQQQQQHPPQTISSANGSN